MPPTPQTIPNNFIQPHIRERPKVSKPTKTDKMQVNTGLRGFQRDEKKKRNQNLKSKIAFKCKNSVPGQFLRQYHSQGRPHKCKAANKSAKIRVFTNLGTKNTLQSINESPSTRCRLSCSLLLHWLLCSFRSLFGLSHVLCFPVVGLTHQECLQATQ